MFKQTYLAQPEDIVPSFAAAWNDRDATSLANLFAEDAEFVNVVGLWWHNRNDIWKAHEYGLRVIFNQSLVEIRKVAKRTLGDSVALIHARMKLSNQTNVGDVVQPAARKNIFSFVLEKKDLGWVCVSAHNTDIVPGKETNVVDEKGNLSSVDYRSTLSD